MADAIKPLVDLARRAEGRHRKEARRLAYRNTAAFNEANFYRTIIKRSFLCWRDREVLLAFVNLAFYHRKPAQISPSMDYLCRRTGLCLNTVRKYVRASIDRGFLRVVGGGSGRGNKVRYAVDLYAIQQTLDPAATVATADESGTPDGEIADTEKGSNPPSRDRRLSRHALRPWRPLRFRLLTRNPERTFRAVMDRLADNLTSGIHPPGPSDRYATELAPIWRRLADGNKREAVRDVARDTRKQARGILSQGHTVTAMIAFP